MKPPIIPEQPVPVVDEDEMRRLVKACAGHDFADRRDLAIILLLADTGIRRSECANLKVADVDRLVGARNLDVGTVGAIQSARTFEEFKLSAERSFLIAKLREHDWNVAETARALQMPRSNLYKKIERHRLARDDA